MKKVLIILALALVTITAGAFAGYYYLKDYYTDQVPSSEDTFSAMIKNYFISQSEEKYSSYKSINGLEDVKVIDLSVEHVDDISFVKILFNNRSNEKIDSKKSVLYLYDKSGNLILNFAFKLPDIETKSEASYNIACADNIQNVGDYRIEIEK